ncbi:MAG: hypothetical protein IT371_27940 [Deltaproteobacteria bacterium]|nr:hypothetical protein [Deltaproteobacteria bacterium]
MGWRWTFVLGAVVALLGFAAPPRATAHPTGKELRNVKQCQVLPPPMRGHCVVCVTRPVRHHFHPEYPPGARCRPDNGKP